MEEISQHIYCGYLACQKVKKQLLSCLKKAVLYNRRFKRFLFCPLSRRI